MPFASALAACEFTVTQRPKPVIAEVSNPSTRGVSATTTMTVRNRGSTDCLLLVTPTINGVAQTDFYMPDSEITVELEVEGGTPRGRLGNYLARVAAGERRTVTFRLTFDIPPAQSAGRYREEVDLRIAQLGFNRQSLESIRIPILLDIDEFATFRFATTGSRTATLDLGELETGTRGQLLLYVIANEDYRLVFNSENQGRMVNTGNSDETIDYRLTANGRNINLRTPTSFEGEEPEYGLAPIRLEVEVKKVKKQEAGVYRDVVRLTIFADD